MTAADATASSPHGDRVQIHEHFDCSREELWAAITDGDQLSAWFGGTCTIEPRVDGAVRFELPDDGITATGVVRAFSPPKPTMTVAHLEHTFVEDAQPDMVMVCGWSVVRLDDGCDLHFTMDGVGDEPPGLLADIWDRIGHEAGEGTATAEADAIDAYASARTVLLVDWVLGEIPRTIAATAPVVYAKVGPKPDDWAILEPDDSESGYRVRRTGRPPDHVDLLHLDWTLEFEAFVRVAHELGAKTFWYHSARTRPPAPADNRGCWVPARQSARQRQVVETAGMTYIDNHYIVDIATKAAGTT